MNEILFFASLSLLGYLIGICVGLLGIGGGLFFVPTLYFFLPMIGVNESVVVLTSIATSLFAGSFASTGSFFNHLRINNVNKKAAIKFSAGSVTTAIIVSRIVPEIDTGFLKSFLCIVLFLVALRMMIEDKNTSNRILLNENYLFLFGILVGVISTFTGLGGGVIIVPTLFYLFSFDIKKAIGTSSLVVALTMIFSALSFTLTNIPQNTSEYQIGYVNLIAGLPLGLSAMFGSKMGVKFVQKYSSSFVKKIFSVILILVVIKILFG